MTFAKQFFHIFFGLIFYLNNWSICDAPDGADELTGPEPTTAGC